VEIWDEIWDEIWRDLGEIWGRDLGDLGQPRNSDIRELQNVIERAAIRAQLGPLEFDLDEAPSASRRSSDSTVGHNRQAIFTDRELKRRERDNVLAALESCYWRISGPDGAAKLLGLRPTTLASKIKAMKLREK